MAKILLEKFSFSANSVTALFCVFLHFIFCFYLYVGLSHERHQISVYGCSLQGSLGLSLSLLLHSAEPKESRMQVQ